MKPNDAPTTSVKTLIQRARRSLRRVADRPRHEAELLLAHVLKCDRIWLLAHPEARPEPEHLAAYQTLVTRRAANIPLPYLLGTWPFYGRNFTVTPAVLIPRPETERLVEEALGWIVTHPIDRAVDVGTGSGCIAVTLAAEISTLHVVATDLSAAALRVARTNARRHDVAARVRCVHANLLAPLLGPFDLIVSNPPYVAADEWETLPTSVQQEPRRALLAGPEGLDAIRRLLTQAQRRLAADGLLLVEIGETQGAAVRALAREAFPRGEVRILKDLAGKERLLQVIAS
jgi:release factor glutamine methyltransferase